MGEISDALARAKRAGKTEDASKSRRVSTRADQSEKTDPTELTELTDEDMLAERSPADMETSEAPTKFEQETSAASRNRGEKETGASGLDARMRAQILSKPAVAKVSSAVPTAAPEPPARYRIPQVHDDFWMQRLCAVEPDGPIAVRFRHFAARVRSLMDQSKRSSVLVTSAFPGEGKTTVATNLALALASIAPESRIALVDFDLRRGTVGLVMGYEDGRGIESALAGKCSLDDVRIETDLNRLDFYPIRRSSPKAHQILGGSIKRILGELHNRYDYVICDGPPVLPVPDVPLIAPHVGGCLAIVGSGKTRHKSFRQLIELVPRESLFGVFLNECSAATSGGDYRYYGTQSTDEDDEE